MNKKRKWLKIVVGVAIIAVGGFLISTFVAQGSLPAMAYTELSRGDLIDSLSTMGSVESIEKRYIHSTIGLTVREVSVEVGDYVHAGQVLALLDTDNLELDIAARWAELNLAQESAQKQLEITEQAYNESAVNIRQGTNSQILNAESSFRTAEANLNTALINFNNALRDNNENTDPQVRTAMTNLEAAQRTYNDALRDYNQRSDPQIRTARVNLDTAQRNYDEALSDYIENTDPQIQTMALNLEIAQRNYDDALSDMQNNLNANISGAESALVNAEIELDIRRRAFEDHRILYDVDGVSREELQRAEDAYIAAQNMFSDAGVTLDTAGNAQTRSLEQLESALESAQQNYDNAVIAQRRVLDQAESSLASARTAYENALSVQRHTLEQAENSLRSARTALENALSTQIRSLEQAETSFSSSRTALESAQSVLDAARVNANQDLERLRGNVETAEISTNVEPQLIAIQRLERQLEDSIITSPVFGTVTAVFAREGAAGTGLLFVIEDIDNLKINTRIREFDVGRVRPGMSVSIRSDSTGNAVYAGELSMIEPAAIKNAAGATDTVSDIEFGAEIQVAEQSGLLIGMEARLTIEIEKRENVFMLPYDAIELYEDGTGVIYVAEEERPNQYIARRMEVETGLETDFFVEIMGAGLYDGMKILNDTDQITEGMSLALN